MGHKLDIDSPTYWFTHVVTRRSVRGIIEGECVDLGGQSVEARKVVTLVAVVQAQGHPVDQKERVWCRCVVHAQLVLNVAYGIGGIRFHCVTPKKY